MTELALRTGAGVFEVLANVCRSPQEALRQFVENAADAIEQAKTDEGHIRLKLRYQPVSNGHTGVSLQGITIQDNGVGMTLDKMKQVPQRIGDSEKIHLVLRGEQGIGLLAFSQIAQELHLASTAREGAPSSCLVLKRPWLKEGHAEVIEKCPAHEHTSRGTVAYLEGIQPEVAAQLSKARIKEYVGQQFASDLRLNLYTVSISDNHDWEQVYPQHFRGLKVLSTALPLGQAGSAFVELYVLPWEMPDATISLYGRSGMRICLLTDLADFKAMPWLDRRLEGYIRCDRLKRTADKTAVVTDQVYSVFANALRELEPRIQHLIAEVSSESQDRRFNIIAGRVGRLVDKFVRYREKGLILELPYATAGTSRQRSPAATVCKPAPERDITADKARPPRTVRAPEHAPVVRLQSPPQDRSSSRSWYDPGQGVIYINREHAEFLLSQREDRRCIRYLFSVWAKESLLQEYGAQAEKVADEMVGVLAEAEPLLR